MTKKYVGLLPATLLLFAATAALSQPRRGRRGPPREAVDACRGKSSGVACTFRFRDLDISGRCMVPPRRKDLVCVPNRYRRPPR